jgi:hypothetical protein
VPPVVEETLRSSGQPLDLTTRRFMESRFGHDFSRVRVHTDARAVDSVRAVDALAYTVGTHVVFGAGQFAPGTARGKRVLAHELAHVVQQGNAAAPVPLRLSLSALRSPLEDEAEAAAGAIETGQPAAVAERDEATAQLQRLPVPPGVELKAPIEAASYVAALALSCDRKSPLGWADFTGAVPAKARHDANTGFHYDRETASGSTVIKAFFDGGRSWVRRQFSDPINRAVNGFAGKLRSCQAWFDRVARSGGTGATYHLTPGTGCAASVQPDPAVTANARGECETVLGPEWDRVAGLESQRLLNHEQYHYNLACALAARGTQAVHNGSDPAAILTTVTSVSTTQTGNYDTQTSHGCDATAQGDWEKEIRLGLPKVSVTAGARP